MVTMGVSMKNKGFTLIELLAVLVLLAVISVITIPNVLTSLNNTKEQTLLRSADNLIKTAELKFLDSIFQGYHSTYEEGILTSGEELSFKGKTPDYLAINVNDEGRVSIAMWDNSINKCVVKGYDDNETRFEVAADYAECMSYVEVEIILFTQVTDTNPGVICSATETEDYANNSTCYIRSIEDLVQLSELAKTNNFSTKTIYLEANLDFENDLSYINPNTTVFGDINGNSIIEPLKTELTTGAGFLPIGNNTVYFSGSFNGNMNILQNLYINRNIAYVGLFGRTSVATIEGLNVNNYTITGANYTGLIGHATSSTVKGLNLIGGNISGVDYVGNAFGYATGSTSVLSAINVQGDVTGRNYVGGIAGYLISAAAVQNATVNSNVTGLDSVGGVVGSTYSMTTGGIVRDTIYIGGSVTDTDATGYFNRMIGRGVESNIYANEDILVNGITVASSSSHGTNTKASYLAHISFYNTVLDTYSGGDNDADGYYFDYDNEWDLIVYKAISPAPLLGSGTVEDPYLMYNYIDLKKATYDLSKVYKLMGNVDFLNKKVYPFGNGTAYFTGKFDGNGYTLSNIEIYGANYTGLFGRTSVATIEGLNVNNYTITGANYTGLIGHATSSTVKGLNLIGGNISGVDYVGNAFGYATGSTSVLSAINVQGDVTGRNYVGGIAGYLISAAAVQNATVNSNVTGLDSVGGVVGSTYSMTTGGIVRDTIYIGGSVTDTDATGYFNRMIGRGVESNIYANEDILVNGITVASSSSHGTNTKASYLAHISFYDTVLDTYSGGDNDADGYYFDYNSDGVLVVLKATAPIPLIGSGTVEDPYLIYTYNDMKRASYDFTKSYKLMSDINLLNRKIYPFGNNVLSFTGRFDGNGYTLSNIEIYGANYTGLFGKTSVATIEGLNINNYTITGANYTGLIGYATSSTIKGLNLVGGNVNGIDHVGSAIGYAIGSTSILSAINSQCNISGRNYIGGIIGNTNSAVVNSLIFEGNVTGTGTNVAGILGYRNSGSASNLVYKGGALSGSSPINRISTNNTSSYSISNNQVTLNGSTITSTNLSGFDGQDINVSYLNSISVYESLGTDTFIGGDNNADGYYLSYDNVSNILFVKATPSVITMNGAGTSVSPYLITNASELEQVSYNLTAYYRLENDIDFAGQRIAMLSSAQNIFSGSFDGNGKTLSNFEINGVEYTGLFGRATGATIEGLNVNNFTITGQVYTGLVGYATSTVIKGLNLYNGDVTGTSNVGLAAGVLFSTGASMNSVYAQGTATGTTYVGGVIGQGATATANYLIFDGDVSGTSNVAGIIGYKNSVTGVGYVLMDGTISSTSLPANRLTANNTQTRGIVNENVLLNGVTIVDNNLTGFNGRNINPIYLNDINIYETLGIDTYIGGDNDSNGYYLEIDSNLKPVFIKTANPVITMSGSGTSLNPYLITNASELEQVSYNLTAYYRLENDIDLGNNIIPMLSSDYNIFLGSFDGNGKTLSNFKISGVEYTGLFGRTNGATIENLNINNFTITGQVYTGLIGYATSTVVKGLNLYNGNVTGTSNVGLAAGVLFSTGASMNSVYAQGTATGTTYVGGVIGQGAVATANYLIFDGNVSGTSNVAGIIGYKSSVNGVGYVLMDGMISSTSLPASRLTTNNTQTSGISNNEVLVNGVTVTSSNLGGFEGQDKTPAELLLQSTYTTIGFNFTDTTPGTYIWRISGSDIWVERN
jgi:prepilin-type N-terminal cleavage/methylation domain-containing protein